MSYFTAPKDIKIPLYIDTLKYFYNYVSYFFNSEVEYNRSLTQEVEILTTDSGLQIF